MPLRGAMTDGIIAMQKRTNLMTTALLVLLVVGTGAAQSAMRADANAEIRPSEGRPEAAFALRFAPPEIRAAPGTTATLEVRAEALRETTVALRVRTAEGLTAHLGAENLTLVPGRATVTRIAVQVAADANASALPVFLEATDASGAMVQARATVVLRAPETRPCRGPNESAPPSCPMRPAERIGFRLADRDPGVPREGGVVALLLQGGATDTFVTLRPRVDEDSGWRVSLDARQVALPAHARTWVSVRLEPLDGAAPGLRYVIEGHLPPGPAGEARALEAHGSAHLLAARMP